jgi:hypothetical protein
MEATMAIQPSTDALGQYPLLDALLDRRSRRFGLGMNMTGGPLAYQSDRQRQPLSVDEEAALAFAACGVPGYALGDLPYSSGPEPESGSGNMMASFLGRTIASADALHLVTLFVINDAGAWMIKRPQDFPREEIPKLIQMARERNLTELYEKSRVRVADRRVDVPREPPHVPTFNKWSANQPGTTYFLPVNELSALYINFLLAAFNEEFGYFVVDDRNGYRPAGLDRFARSKGGHLSDDPARGRFGSISVFETWLHEFVAIEQGGMLQNLGLMTQALGLGGFPHFAAHPFSWFQSLGFRVDNVPFSRTIAAGPIMRAVLKLLGKDMPVPTPLGLEQNGTVLLKPYCPPYYRNMQEAVLAFVDYKFAAGRGTFRDGGVVTGWLDPRKIQAGIPEYSDRTIAAVTAYCDYVYSRYGRFPADNGPFRTILAHQAHRLDADFYARFYRPEVLSEMRERER